MAIHQLPQRDPESSGARVTLPAGLAFREATDADAAGMIALVGGCYAEYQGMVLELDGEDSDLPHPATAFAKGGGTLWVVTSGGEHVVASVGIKPVKDDAKAVELKRLYVEKAARRQGLAGWLLSHAEREAVCRGATRMTLWSDTRLCDAHRFYENRGYRRGPETRERHDLSNSVEFFFDRVLI